MPFLAAHGGLGELSCNKRLYSKRFYAQLLLSARLSHRNSVRPSVTRMDQSKTVQARITKSSPSVAWKTSFRNRKAFT